METRKIQKVGSGTFTVSLPKEWAESEGITTGTVVNLHTHLDGLLVVQTQEHEDATSEQVTLHVDHDDAEGLEQVVRAAYAAGTRTVTLEAADAFTTEQRQRVGAVVRSLVGVTVVEETDARMTIRTLLDPNEVSIRQSVRQLLFLTLSMHRDATAALTDDGVTGAFTDRDDQADRTYAMVERHFSRGLARLDEVDALGLARPQLFELYVTARELERVADHAERIADVAATADAESSSTVASEIAATAETARGAVEDAVSVVVDGSGVETATAALDARDRVREDVASLDRRLFEAESADYRLTHALDSVRRTAEHAGNIAETGLQTAIRRGDLSVAIEADGDHQFPASAESDS
jgi:phosphate uptake regulator